MVANDDCTNGTRLKITNLDESAAGVRIKTKTVSSRGGYRLACLLFYFTDGSGLVRKSAATSQKPESGEG